MSTRRKSSANISSAANRQQRNPLNNFNIKSEVLRGEAKGTKPTCEVSSVKDVLVMALLHMCKKAIFYDVRLKVGLYMLALFVVSLIGGEWKLTLTLSFPGSSTSPLSLQTSYPSRNRISLAPTIFSTFISLSWAGFGLCFSRRLFFTSQTLRCAAVTCRSSWNIMSHDLLSRRCSGTAGRTYST